MSIIKRFFISCLILACAVVDVRAMRVALFDQTNQTLRISSDGQLVPSLTTDASVALTFAGGALAVKSGCKKKYFNKVTLECGEVAATAEQQQAITDYCTYYMYNYTPSSARISDYLNKSRSDLRENPSVALFTAQMTIFDEVTKNEIDQVFLLDEQGNKIYISDYDELGCDPLSEGFALARPVCMRFCLGEDQKKYCSARLCCGNFLANQEEQRSICDYISRFKVIAGRNQLFCKQLAIMESDLALQQKTEICSLNIDFADDSSYDLMEKSNKNPEDEFKLQAVDPFWQDPEYLKPFEPEEDDFFSCLNTPTK